MKIKSQPEDFAVEELTHFEPSTGPFAFYVLEKRWLGTPEAIARLCERWKVERRNIAYGGLKDFHGVTRQYLTIFRGPKDVYEDDRCRAEYLGQAPRAYGPADIAANRFEVVARDLSATEAAKLPQALDDVARDGLPNYFDEQRFGSLGESGEFVAKPWCLGNYERALWLALAEYNSHDQPRDKQEKAIIQARWGDWKTCKAELPKSSRRSIITFLDDRPGDFKGAFARMNVDLRGLYISAFQSDVWNRAAAILIERYTSPEDRFDAPLFPRPLPFYRRLDDRGREMLELSLPLPSQRLKLPPGELNELFAQALQPHEMELKRMGIRYPRDTFFAKAERPLVLEPQGVEHSVANDEFHAYKKAATLAFELPRGAYATLFMKRLEAAIA